MEQAEVDLQLDLPPEYCAYSDEGCDLAPSCLNCPFPHCRYDAPGEGTRQVKGQRDGELLRLRLEGTSIARLAQRFGLSQRTVYRITRRDKHG
ncbi:MAG: helix-turn-helix domain-containing protein [Chloroflexi bacterium]|nr:helix-turn-helix domain-containing protein [Chloroflexota bacterium]